MVLFPPPRYLQRRVLLSLRCRRHPPSSTPFPFPSVPTGPHPFSSLLGLPCHTSSSGSRLDLLSSLPFPSSQSVCEVLKLYPYALPVIKNNTFVGGSYMWTVYLTITVPWWVSRKSQVSGPKEEFPGPKEAFHGGTVFLVLPVTFLNTFSTRRGKVCSDGSSRPFPLTLTGLEPETVPLPKDRPDGPNVRSWCGLQGTSVFNIEEKGNVRRIPDNTRPS